MLFRKQLGAARRYYLSSFCARPAVLTSGPVISFTFDDFPRTALTAGGEILKEFGARGTYYAAPSLMNTSNELGELFRREDLDKVLEDSHELGNHTFSHISSRAVPVNKFCEDAHRGEDAIRKITGLSNLLNFSYPYGHVTLKVKKELDARMPSCRGIYGGSNEQRVDLNLLRANSVYGEVNSFDKAKELIQENARVRGWLIFYTHDIRAFPSPFGCTPELFRGVVTCAAEHGRLARVTDVMSELDQSATK